MCLCSVRLLLVVVTMKTGMTQGMTTGLHTKHGCKEKRTCKRFGDFNKKLNSVTLHGVKKVWPGAMPAQKNSSDV